MSFNKPIDIDRFFRKLLIDTVGRENYLNAIKEVLYKVLKENPLYKQKIYFHDKFYNLPNYYIDKVLLKLLEENKAFKLTFKQKSNLNLKEYLTYYSTDKKIRL